MPRLALLLAFTFAGCGEGRAGPIAPDADDTFTTCLALIGVACERTAK